MQTYQKYLIKSTDLFLDESSQSSSGLKQYILKIKDMPLADQPREKLLSGNLDSLSISDLLSVILNSGTKKEGVLEISRRIIKEYGEKSIMSEKDPDKLSKTLDIPLIKACQIVACGELGRRVFDKNDNGFTIIRNAKDVFDHLYDMRFLPKEHLRVLYLNTHNRIIHDEVISIGTINTNIIHPREVFRPAIQYSAAAIILAHNHPSGISAPSNEDLEITKQIIQAGKIIGINVLDHVIITKDTFISIESNYA